MRDQINIAFLAAAFVISVGLIYQLLPAIVVYIDPRLHSVLPVAPARKSRPFYRLGRWLKHWRSLEQFLGHLQQRLLQSGDERPNSLQLYLRSQLYWICGAVAATVILKLPGYQGLLVAVMVIALKNSRIEHKIQLRKSMLERSFYKIYRFIDSQINAGIKATDVLKGLHEATDDPFVKPLLIRFVGRYSLTLDLDQAVEELRRLQAGKDVDTLGTQLRQLLATGSAGKSFQRTEALLFTRYFALLQKQSEAIRNRLLIAAIFLMIPTVLLFLLPMLYQAVYALGNVFS